MMIMCFLSADVPLSEMFDLQRVSMLKLVGVPAVPHIPATINDLSTPRHDIHPYFWDIDNTNCIEGKVCTWKGIDCVDEIVQRIHWCPYADENRAVSLKVIDLYWIPPSVSNIEIRSLPCSSLVQFSTRTLPRAALRVEISRMNLTGSLEVAALPPHITHLNVACNKLSGRVDLRGMPKSLEALDAGRNYFTQVIVDNNELPMSLQSVKFGPKRSRVEEFAIYEVSNTKIDPRVRVAKMKTGR